MLILHRSKILPGELPLKGSTRINNFNYLPKAFYFAPNKCTKQYTLDDNNGGDTKLTELEQKISTARFNKNSCLNIMVPDKNKTVGINEDTF